MNYLRKNWGDGWGMTKPRRVVIQSKRGVGQACVNRDYALWHKCSRENILCLAFMLEIKRRRAQPRCSANRGRSKQNTTQTNSDGFRGNVGFGVFTVIQGLGHSENNTTVYYRAGRY